MIKTVWTCLVLFTPLAAFAQVSILPPAPKMLDIVRVFVPGTAFGLDLQGKFDSYSSADTEVSMMGNKITVSLLMRGHTDFNEIPPTPTLEMPVGQLPAGSYELEVVKRAVGTGSPGRVGSAMFTVSGRAAGDPLWNHSDLWWNPSESGMGMNVVLHGSGKLFAVWYVYDEQQRPVWYVIPDGLWSHSVNYDGQIYRTTGPYFGSAFDPSRVSVIPVGTARLTFDEYNSNKMTFGTTINGVTIIKNLQRQSF